MAWLQIAATRAPERCAGLVLTNAVAYDSWPIPEVRAMRAAGALVKRLPRLLRAQLWLLLRQGHDSGGRASESLDVHWPGYDHPEGAATLVRQMRSLRSRDTEQVASALPDLHVPAAVVWGAADRFQKLDPYGRRLAADLDARLDVIDGGKHFTPEDHPDRIAAGIRASTPEAAPRLTCARTTSIDGRSRGRRCGRASGSSRRRRPIDGPADPQKASSAQPMPSAAAMRM